MFQKVFASDLFGFCHWECVDVEKQHRVHVLADGLIFKGHDDGRVEMPDVLLLEIECLNWREGATGTFLCPGAALKAI